MNTDPLFASADLGSLSLRNRIIMAPMTRSRAGSGDAPTALNALYYAQRAGAGLIITEGTQVSGQGQGYLYTPGLYSEAQTKGWRGVVDAVHAAGGRIFAQLWHVGRVSHVSLQPGGGSPISATDQVARETKSFAFDASGSPAQVPASRPRVATLSELAEVITDFREAAANAKAAGFDGVELHAANGYFLDQHLNSVLNTRSDAYGGQSPASRTRLVLEIFDAVAEVFEPGRIGVRISPHGVLHDMPLDPQAELTAVVLATQLRQRKAAYLHIQRGGEPTSPLVSDRLLSDLREAFPGPILVTGGLDKTEASRLIREGFADFAGFASAFIANPDLVDRLAVDWPLTPVDPTTIYGGDERGYTDYPRAGSVRSGGSDTDRDATAP